MGRKLALPTLGKSIADIINDAADKIQQGGDQVKEQTRPYRRQQQINQQAQIKPPEVNSLVPGSDNVDEETKEENEEEDQNPYAGLMEIQEKQASEDNWQNNIPRTQDLGINYDQSLMRPNDFQYSIEDRQDMQKARDAGLDPNSVKLQDRPKEGQVESRGAHDFRRSLTEAEAENKAEHGSDYDAWPDWFRNLENWYDAQQIMGSKGYDPLKYAQAEVAALGEGINAGTAIIANLRNDWAKDTAEYQFDVNGKEHIDAEDFDAALDDYINKINAGPDAVAPEERDAWMAEHWTNDRNKIGNRSATPYKVTVTDLGIKGLDGFSFGTADTNVAQQQVDDMILRGDIVRSGDGYLVNGQYVPDLAYSMTTEQEELPMDQMDNADYYQIMDNMVLPDGTELTADEVNMARNAERYQSNLMPFNINKVDPSIQDENYNLILGPDIIPAAIDGLLGSGPRMFGPTMWPILGGDLIARSQGLDPSTYDPETHTYADPGVNNTIDKYILGFVSSLFDNIGERYIGKWGGDFLLGGKVPLREAAALAVANGARKAFGAAPKETIGRLGKTIAGAASEGWEEILAGPIGEMGSKGLNIYAEPEQLANGDYAYDPETLNYIYQYDTPIEKRLGNLASSSVANALLGGAGGLAMHGATNGLGALGDVVRNREYKKIQKKQQKLEDDYNAEIQRQQYAQMQPGDDAAVDYYEQQKAKANK